MSVVVRDLEKEIVLKKIKDSLMLPHYGAHGSLMRLHLHLTYFYPLGLAKDCVDLEERSSFYSFFAAERGASPGNELIFEIYRLPVDLQSYQGDCWKALFLRIIFERKREF